MDESSVKHLSRAEQMAAHTRDDILSAARRLFAERGYSGTSIQDIAAEAGVAVQTIYSRLGSKSGMLFALVDKIQDESGMSAKLPRIFGATTATEVVRGYVAVTRGFQENCGDVIGALFSSVGAAPELDDFVAEGRRRHRDGAKKVVELLEKFQSLAPGLTSQAAVAFLAATTSYEAWAELRTAGLGWDDIEQVLADTLCRALLAADAVPG